MSNPRTIFQTTISKIIDHTPHVRELVLQVHEPHEFKFRAGQFAMLHVPQEAGKPALRAYSIASDDRSTKEFHLIFKHVPNGIASTYVWSLTGTEVLNFTGPFGRVYFAEPPSKQIVFLATGTGLAQHLSYLYSKAELYPDVQFRLLHGVHDEHSVFCLNELNKLKKKLRNFDYDIVLSRPLPTWKGKGGYVQQFLNDFDFKNIDTSFYLCGNRNMINQTKHLLIEESGFDAGKIHSEAFD